MFGFTRLFYSSLRFTDCLLFGAIISATDPGKYPLWCLNYCSLRYAYSPKHWFYAYSYSVILSDGDVTDKSIGRRIITNLKLIDNALPDKS